jgi:hypothetical protein
VLQDLPMDYTIALVEQKLPEDSAIPTCIATELDRSTAFSQMTEVSSISFLLRKLSEDSAISWALQNLPENSTIPLVIHRLPEDSAIHTAPVVAFAGVCNSLGTAAASEEFGNPLGILDAPGGFRFSQGV